jgi:hypothetical protein
MSDSVAIPKKSGLDTGMEIQTYHVVIPAQAGIH